SGWRDTDGDGIRDKIIDGKKRDLQLTLVANFENDLRKDAAQSIKLQLSELRNNLGIEIDIKLATWDEINKEIIPNKDFDLLLTGYYLPQMPDVGFIFDFDSKLVNYKSMQLDDLILNARHEAADEDIKEAYKDIQRYFVEHLP